MKQQEVFNRIGGIIKELNDQFKYLQDDPSKINELELELFVANAHFLANHAEVLKKVSQQEQAAQAPIAAQPITIPQPPPAAAQPVAAPEPPPLEQPAPPKEEKYFEPFVHEAPQVDNRPAAQIDLSGAAPEDGYSYIRQSEPDIIKHDLEIDESWIDDEDEEDLIPAIEEPEPEPAIAKVPEKPVETAAPVPPLVVEQPAPQVVKKEEPEVMTINQRMSAQFGSKHESSLPPITDLKSAITLNDKLLFVKDLFNGYGMAYSEAIDILNKQKNFNEADQYLKSSYAVKNNWESKPETTEKFYSLLRRRFA